VAETEQPACQIENRVTSGTLSRGRMLRRRCAREPALRDGRDYTGDPAISSMPPRAFRDRR
jgi:hypothetical protein